MKNIDIEKFKTNFTNLLNSSTDLPIGVIYIILKQQLLQIEQLYYATLNSELQQEAEKWQEENNQKSSTSQD